MTSPTLTLEGRDGRGASHHSFDITGIPGRGPAVVRLLRRGSGGATGSKEVGGFEDLKGMGEQKGEQPLPENESVLVLCSQSLFRFADLGDDGLCRGGPDKGCGVIVSAIDVVVDRLD